MRTILAPLLSVILMLASLAMLPSALGHAPEFGGGNESLDNATIVSEPTKSWVIYGELLEGGEAQYYRLNMSAGESIFAQVTVPVEEGDRDFTPSFVLIGPGLSSNTTPPSFVQVPAGNGTIVVNGSKANAPDYEPFSPSAFFVVGQIEQEAHQDGNYYLAVYDNRSGGRYSVAIGERESFTLAEWILIPLSQLRIYEWEGQEQQIILLPIVLTILTGAVVLTLYARRRAIAATAFILIGSLAGLFFIGSGMSEIYQMLLCLSQTGSSPTALVTLIFATLPILLGICAIRVAWRAGHSAIVTTKTRILMLSLGIAGLFLWAGLFIGPIAAVLASVSPGISPKRRI